MKRGRQFGDTAHAAGVTKPKGMDPRLDGEIDDDRPAGRDGADLLREAVQRPLHIVRKGIADRPESDLPFGFQGLSGSAAATAAATNQTDLDLVAPPDVGRAGDPLIEPQHGAAGDDRRGPLDELPTRMAGGSILARLIGHDRLRRKDK